MSEKGSFLEELKRRKVARVALVYGAGAWFALQLVDTLGPILELQDWVGRTVLLVLLAGFPIAVVLAWVFDVTPSGVKRTSSEAGPDLAPNTSRGWLSPRTAGVAVLFVLTGVVIGWLFGSISGVQSGAANDVVEGADLIAVLPFSTTGDGVEFFGTGMMDLLSTNLDEVEAIRTVDPSVILNRTEAGQTLLSEAEGLALGAELNAGSILMGRVVGSGAEVRVTANLLTSAGVEIASVTIEGAADDLFGLADNLTLEILGEVWRSNEPIPTVQLAAVTTTSLDALRSYVEGQNLYRSWKLDDAEAAFRQAIEADSLFALAHYGLGAVFGWGTPTRANDNAGAQRHLNIAFSLSERLPVRERRLIGIQRAYQNGFMREAGDSAEAVGRSLPEDADAQYHLGERRYHSWGWRSLGLEPDSILAPFRRAVELDPKYVPAYVHPAMLVSTIGDSVDGDWWLERWADVLDGLGENSGVTLSFRGPTQSNAFVDTLLTQYTSLPPRVWDTNDEGITVAENFGIWARPDFVESIAAGSILGVGLRVSRGLMTAARSGTDELAQRLPEAARYAEWRAVASGIAPSEFWTRGRPTPAEEVFVTRSFWSLSVPYPMAEMLVSLISGDANSSRVWAATGSAQDEAGQYEASYAAGIAWAEVVEGDTIGGIRRLVGAMEQLPVWEWEDGSPPEQFLMFHAARLMTLHTDTRSEGLAKLKNGRFTVPELMVLRYEALAEGYVATGNLDQARNHYEVLLTLWDQAEPSLEARVQAARNALQTLGGVN